jgi:cobalt-zinc-cadmium efflux system protein
VSDAGAHREAVRRALLLTVAVFGAEVVGGLLSGSLALLADAAHMMTDLGGLLMSYAAMSLAERPATRHHTYGLHRAEILAAFVNAEILLVAAALILWEAYRRLLVPLEIHTGLMMGVAVVGLVANLVAMRLLHGGHEESLNLRAAYLEVLTDALSSVGVIAGALVIAATGWAWIDPAISVAIGVAIVPRTIRLFRDATHILLEGTPPNVDLRALRRDLLRLAGVEAVHDLHVWTLTSGLHAVSVHIRAAVDTPRGRVLGSVLEFLRRDSGLDHATVQVEWGSEVSCEAAQGHD